MNTKRIATVFCRIGKEQQFLFSAFATSMDVNARAMNALQQNKLNMNTHL